MKKEIEAIKERMNDTNTTEGHMNISMKDGSTTVLSIYNTDRPCFIVLRELMEWAKLNENKSLLRKINELKNPQIKNPPIKN